MQLRFAFKNQIAGVDPQWNGSRIMQHGGDDQGFPFGEGHIQLAGHGVRQIAHVQMVPRQHGIDQVQGSGKAHDQMKGVDA